MFYIFFQFNCVHQFPWLYRGRSSKSKHPEISGQEMQDFRWTMGVALERTWGTITFCPVASLALTDTLPAKKPGMLSFPGAPGSHAREIIIFLINEAAVLTLLSFYLQTVQFYTNMKTTFTGNKTKHKFLPIVVKRFHIV